MYFTHLTLNLWFFEIFTFTACSESAPNAGFSQGKSIKDISVFTDDYLAFQQGWDHTDPPGPLMLPPLNPRHPPLSHGLVLTDCVTHSKVASLKVYCSLLLYSCLRVNMIT